jgi:hypothetical protein
VSGVWHIDQGEENDPSALLVNEDFVLMTAGEGRLPRL